MHEARCCQDAGRVFIIICSFISCVDSTENREPCLQVGASVVVHYHKCDSVYSRSTFIAEIPPGGSRPQKRTAQALPPHNRGTNTHSAVEHPISQQLVYFPRLVNTTVQYHAGFYQEVNKYKRIREK